MLPACSLTCIWGGGLFQEERLPQDGLFVAFNLFSDFFSLFRLLLSLLVPSFELVVTYTAVDASAFNRDRWWEGKVTPVR